MQTGLTRIYDRHAATVHAGRAWLARLSHDEPGWRFVPRAGHLEVGGVEFSAGLLATESAADGTWLWGWANQGPNLSAALVRTSACIRDFGRHRGIPELAAPEVALIGIDGLYLATIAAGVLGCSTYFQGETEVGAVYLAVPVPPGVLGDGGDHHRLAHDYLQAISALPIMDHRVALLGLARDRGHDVRLSANKVTIGEKASESITAWFVDNRLIRLELSGDPTADGAPPTSGWEECLPGLTPSWGKAGARAIAVPQ